METTKEKMMQFLQELQNLQLWLSNSSHEISLSVIFSIFENSINIDCYTSLFSDIKGTSKSVYLYSSSSYGENQTKLNYFIEYVKKLSKYGNAVIITTKSE